MFQDMVKVNVGGEGSSEMSPLDMINNFTKIFGGSLNYRTSQSITVTSKPKYLLALASGTLSGLNANMWLVDVENNKTLYGTSRNIGSGTYSLSASDGTGIFSTINDTTVTFSESICVAGNSSCYVIGAIF